MTLNMTNDTDTKTTNLKSEIKIYTYFCDILNGGQHPSWTFRM